MENTNERRYAWAIFLTLLIIGILTLLWFRAYHEIQIDNTGFHWNPRDGSVAVTESPQATQQTSSSQSSTDALETKATPPPAVTLQTPQQNSLAQPTSALTTEETAEATKEGEATKEATAEATKEASPQNGSTQSSKSEPQPEQYLSWFQASLLGIIMFLMSEIYYWYPKIGKTNGASFTNYFPWYISNLFQGPIIALVILWILTNINLNLGSTDGGGVSVNFGKLPAIVLLAFAWMLGFYSRVTRKQLDQIMKQLLPQAWAEAQVTKNQFNIEGPSSLIQGQRDRFTTSLNQDSTWLISDPENIKTIELGKYVNSMNSYDANQLPQSLVGINLYVNITALQDPTKSGKIIIRAAVADVSSYAEIEISL